MAESGTAVEAAISADPNAEKGIYTLDSDIYGVVQCFAQNDKRIMKPFLPGIRRSMTGIIQG